MIVTKSLLNEGCTVIQVCFKLAFEQSFHVTHTVQTTFVIRHQFIKSHIPLQGPLVAIYHQDQQGVGSI